MPKGTATLSAEERAELGRKGAEARWGRKRPPKRRRRSGRRRGEKQSVAEKPRETGSRPPFEKDMFMPKLTELEDLLDAIEGECIGKAEARISSVEAGKKEGKKGTTT